MNKTIIPRVMLGFVAVFVVGMAALLVYQALWITPEKACEQKGAWWDPSTRVCATPVTLDKITLRPFGSPKLPIPAKDGPADKVPDNKAPADSNAAN